MKPGSQEGDHGKGRGLLGLARIKVNAAADRAVQLYRATPNNSGNIMSPPPDRAGPGHMTILGSIAALGVLCMGAFTIWRGLEGNPMDVEHLQRPVKDSALRAIGEKTAAQYVGYLNMGLQPPGKRAYMPLDMHKARQSCQGTGHTHGAPQMTVLVTGAGGFIGMHASLMLRRRGHGVLGLDNFNDYYPVALKRARQAQALLDGVYIVDGDLNDGPLLERLLSACTFTHVLHLAAQAGVRYATKNPYSYVHANIAGHVTLLEAIKSQDPMPRLVYASSSSVYGLNKKQPFSEADRVDSPASLYASTKRADELICHTYYNIYGMSVTGLRFFTVYGPWGRPDMAAFKFAINIMSDKPITIFQGPDASELQRDFTYIDDIVDGIMGALAEIPPSQKGMAHYKVYNLGNTHPHTVTEMVDLLERHLGRKAIRKNIPVPATGDVLSTLADISAAKKDLGYSPQVLLDQGLQRFCDWFVRYYSLDAATGHGSGVKSVAAQDWSYNPLR
jgi:UDP-glucuronate 4-epimerase